MALFNYSALDMTNSLTQGVMEGIDKAMVARKLLQQGLRPLEIKPHSEAKRSLPSTLNSGCVVTVAVMKKPSAET